MRLNIQNYKTIMKNLLRSFWSYVPLLIGLAGILIVIYFHLESKPGFVNYSTLQSGNLNEAQKHAVTMAVELNKFIISINTLMFGVLGFFINHYKKEIQVKRVAFAYFLSLILLALTFYYSFRVYSQLTSDLAQNAFAMTPKTSKVLYYLEMAFWSFASSSSVLLSIFISVFIARK